MMPEIASLLQHIDALQAQIQAHQPWDDAARRKIERKLRLDWNYHSQSIEGGTLTRRETRTIMLGSVDVKGKPLKDVLEMQRHDELIQDLMKMGRGEKRLSESRIRNIHQAIMYEEKDTALREQIGEWKTTDNEIINPQGEKFGFTPVAEVPDAIHALLNRTNANWDKLVAGKKDAQHPALMAFDFHLAYLTIHPFYDGNGRTARILLNLILIAFGYPPIIVKTSDKDRYNRLLGEIQGYGASRDLYHEFMAELLLRSQELVLSALRGEEIEEEDDLVKEIALFKRQQEAKAKGVTPVEYSPQVFESALTMVILPLYEAIRAKSKQLNDFFNRRTDEIETQVIDPEGFLIKRSKEILKLEGHIEPSSLFPKFPMAETPEFFNYRINLHGYLFKIKYPFDLSITIATEFQSHGMVIYYQIFRESEVYVDIAYAELPQLDFDAQAFARETLRALFDALKTKAAHD